MGRRKSPAKAAIVVIGTELTQGFTQESNSVFLAQWLNERGLIVHSVQKIPDDIGLIVEAVRGRAADADVLIITGGLGSTHDDVTREALARLLEVPLSKDKYTAESIAARMPAGADPEAFMRQAYLPEGTKPIMPDGGTAPGVLANLGETLIFALPGVPREIEQMLDFVDDELHRLRLAAAKPLTVRLSITGSSEPEVARLMAPVLEAYPGITFNILAKPEGISLTLFSHEQPTGTGRSELDRAFADIEARLGTLIFSDKGQSLPEVVGDLLVKHRLTLGVAESLTAGQIGALVATVPGASCYLKGGVISYSDQAKIDLLGVDAAVLEKRGAVSAETAAAMAAGVRRAVGSDIGLAVTGIAGPGGATDTKPVGLVYTGLSTKESTEVGKSLHRGDRAMIQNKTAFQALDILRLYLAKNYG